MRKWIRIIVVVAVAGLCADVAASSTGEWGNTPTVTNVTYLGRTLHCMVVEDGAEAGHIGGISCDYVRFWRGR